MKNNIPTTEIARRIAALFNRRPTTPWSDKEIRRYRTLLKSGFFSDEELKMVEDYYKAERKKERDGIYRRDLYTFLNHYGGEVDRAKARAVRIGGIISARRKGKKREEPTMSEEEIERGRAFMRECLKTLVGKMKMPDWRSVDPKEIEQSVDGGVQAK